MFIALKQRIPTLNAFGFDNDERRTATKTLRLFLLLRQRELRLPIQVHHERVCNLKLWDVSTLFAKATWGKQNEQNRRHVKRRVSMQRHLLDFDFEFLEKILSWQVLLWKRIWFFEKKPKWLAFRTNFGALDWIFLRKGKLQLFSLFSVACGK